MCTGAAGWPSPLWEVVAEHPDALFDAIAEALRRNDATYRHLVDLADMPGNSRSLKATRMFGRCVSVGSGLPLSWITTRRGSYAQRLPRLFDQAGVKQVGDHRGSNRTNATMRIEGRRLVLAKAYRILAS